MRKIIISILCIINFISCVPNEMLEDVKVSENIVEIPNEEANDTIPENDIEYIKNKINVDNNDKIVDYCIINKDSIWVLSM